MADKLKVLYVLNFNWIFTGMVMWGFICIARGKAGVRSASWWIVSLTVSTLGFTLFSVVFRTVNHARYAAQVPAVLYIIGGYIFLSMLHERAVNVMAGFLAFLLLVSSYRTIDPVSRLCFAVLDTGQGQMLTTGIPAPGDSMIYNKQMLGMEYAVNEAVEYAVRNDCMVIMPMYGVTPNIFDGLMQEMVNQEYGCTALTYWSAEDGKRTIYEEGNALAFTIYEWSAAADIDQLPLAEKDKHCYIYSPILGEDQARQIQERYTDVKYKEYQHGGWVITMLVF